MTLKKALHMPAVLFCAKFIVALGHYSQYMQKSLGRALLEYLDFLEKKMSKINIFAWSLFFGVLLLMGVAAFLDYRDGKMYFWPLPKPPLEKAVSQ